MPERATKQPLAVARNKFLVPAEVVKSIKTAAARTVKQGSEDAHVRSLISFEQTAFADSLYLKRSYDNKEFE